MQEYKEGDRIRLDGVTFRIDMDKELNLPFLYPVGVDINTFRRAVNKVHTEICNARPKGSLEAVEKLLALCEALNEKLLALCEALNEEAFEKIEKKHPPAPENPLPEPTHKDGSKIKDDYIVVEDNDGCERHYEACSDIRDCICKERQDKWNRKTHRCERCGGKFTDKEWRDAFILLGASPVETDIPTTQTESGFVDVPPSPTDEAYPPHWRHCTIHLNTENGEMHSDGDHNVRFYIENKIEKLEKALRPFAMMHRVDEPEFDDNVACQRGTASDMTIVTNGDWKRAAELLGYTHPE